MIRPSDTLIYCCHYWSLLIQTAYLLEVLTSNVSDELFY